VSERAVAECRDLGEVRRLASGDGVAALRQEFKGEREDLIPVLQRLQERDGYLHPDAIRSVSRWLKISENEIFGVATFYAQFRFNPPGKYNIKVCMGTACHVVGARNFVEVLCADLKLSPGETTPDGKFSLERVACLGCCALAPVVVVNDEVHGRMNRVKFTELLETLRHAGEPAEPEPDGGEHKQDDGRPEAGDVRRERS
jgi:NADH:ubiquinone oxidoreductase subunit E